MSPPCNLHYVEFGVNRGDSLEDFVNRDFRKDGGLQKALADALPSWHPSTTCIWGAEPNPRWTSTLRNVSDTLRPRVGRIEVATETAFFADRRTKSLTLTGSSDKNAEGATLLSSMLPARRHGTQHEVRGVYFVDWLRALPWPELPIVIRMDIEGSEYALLRSLAFSGLGATRRIWVSVEWHRYRRNAALAGPMARNLDKLDSGFNYFNRMQGAWVRHGDPRRGPMFNITCRGDHPLSGRLVGNDPCGHASQLIENYEKVLALMLASANITLSDMLSDERRPTAEERAAMLVEAA